MEQQDETRVCIMGNVDSGKSTLIGVLKTNQLDDGRGSARNSVFQFKHEKNTGRTSSVTYHTIFLPNKKKYILIDLAGHEKYLKTTMRGVNGCYPDYCIVTIGANMGISRMTKEHLGIAIYLKLPIVIVITKLDLCPEHILEKTIRRINKILSSKAAGKKICINIENSQDKCQQSYQKFLTDSKVCPIFTISNKTGENLELLKMFIENVNSKRLWDSKHDDILYSIDSSFRVNGVGTVVSGTMLRGTVTKNDRLWLGPFDGKFKSIMIRSIHNNERMHIPYLQSGNIGCFSVKSLEKKEIINANKIKKGMVIMKYPKCVKSFLAEVIVLHHPTTMKVNYQPVIHCGNIRQSANIDSIEKKKYLQTGDHAKIKFRFCYHPEYMEVGALLLFREGKTKGFGKIIEIYDE